MLQEHVSLSEYSNYRIGGPARYFAAPSTHVAMEGVLTDWRTRTHGKGGIFILGGGTNLLIRDEGFPGLVLKPAIMGLAADGLLLTAGAGVLMKDLLEYAMTHQLSGLEWAGGLPGTVGGAVRGNAGAFGGEIKDSVHEVTSATLKSNASKMVRRNGSECNFGYRTSVFKQGKDNEIILSVVFKLKKGDAHAIQSATEEKIRYRNDRHPMEYPNIGSIFKNVPLSQINAEVTQINADTVRVHSRGNSRRSAFTAPVKKDPFPVIPAAYLISQVGLKGVSSGGAMISPKHPNFIVNVLDAKASDVKKLIHLVTMKVRKQFTVVLEEEVMYV